METSKQKLICEKCGAVLQEGEEIRFGCDHYVWKFWPLGCLDCDFESCRFFDVDPEICKKERKISVSSVLTGTGFATLQLTKI